MTVKVQGGGAKLTLKEMLTIATEVGEFSAMMREWEQAHRFVQQCQDSPSEAYRAANALLGASGWVLELIETIEQEIAWANEPPLEEAEAASMARNAEMIA